MKCPDLEMLDNPVWSALTGKQAHLSQGGQLALRFHPQISPFAAVNVITLEATQALSVLASSADVIMQTVNALPSLEGLKTERLGTVCQMISTNVPRSDCSHQVVRLGAADVDEMLALTQATKPGPFKARTLETGNYIGIREHGQLIAMAGERMQFDRYVEISAVCVDTAHRGRGLAGQLMNMLRTEIFQRGGTPFLHVFEHNNAAVELYRRMGFETRQTFHLYRVRSL
jgi:predicted GNAT family acetyltransferase